MVVSARRLHQVTTVVERLIQAIKGAELNGCACGTHKSDMYGTLFKVTF